MELSLWISLIVLGILTISIVLFSRRNSLVQKAKSKAKSIKLEAENFFQAQQLKLKEMDLEFKQKYAQVMHDFQNKEMQREKEIQNKLTELEVKEKLLQERESNLNKTEIQKERVILQYTKAKEELKRILSDHLSMSEEEIKKNLYKLIEEDLSEYKGKLIRRYENEAKNEARKRANYIIAQATTRYAGEFALERLINVITLPNDELKGRIIGKEGRNIKAIEMIAGVDVIIDETPSTIVLSSFNLYRRTIATKLIETLIQDGKIQPSRIEEVYERVKEEMEEQVLQEGEEVVLKLGLGYIHPELKRLIGKMKYRASFGQNALGHSIEVANLAGIIAAELGGDARLAKRAGLLHDIGKSFTQEIGGNHVDLGYEVCVKYQEHPVVLNAIKAHHGNEEIKSIEAAAVCTADILSAARPGARREALENFLKRATDLENLALQKRGVKQAYVINSGREIRVIVDAEINSDEESAVLAKEIASEIEEGFQYPGEIKVSVIRESRAVEFAR